MDPQLLKRIIEAVLLAAGQPLSLAQIAALFTEHETVTHEDLARALEALAADCAERGVELKEVASGFRYQVREDVHGWVARLWTERQTKYSRASLETLALIAYRQPITRAEIEQIRGVAVSSSIIKTLEEREWVRVVGYRDVPGRPALFGTSRAFLDYFNLRSLDELPPLAQVRDLDEYDPQLALAPVALGAAPNDDAADAEAPVADAANDDAGDGDASPDDGAEAPDDADEPAVADATDDATEPDDAALDTDAGGDEEEDEPRALADAGETPVVETAGDADAPPADAQLYDDEESHGSDADAGIVDRDDPVGDAAAPSTDSHPNDTGDDAGEPDPTTSDDVPEHTA